MMKERVERKGEGHEDGFSVVRIQGKGGKNRLYEGRKVNSSGGRKLQ